MSAERDQAADCDKATIQPAQNPEVHAKADPWSLMVLALAGLEPPPPPARPGRRITTRDEPVTSADLEGVTSPRELAALLGISRPAAYQRLKAAARKAEKQRAGG